MNESKKFSTLIVDGKIVDLNKLSEEELEELKQKLENKIKSLREQVDKMM